MTIPFWDANARYTRQMLTSLDSGRVSGQQSGVPGDSGGGRVRLSGWSQDGRDVWRG